MGNCCNKQLSGEERVNPFAPKDGSFTVQSPPHPKGLVIKKNPFPEFANRDVLEYYNLGRELGRGEFGITCLAIDKATGEKLACKSIPKRKLKTAVDIGDVRREVAIMHLLPPHPNIVGLKAVFEDKIAVHIVQELCEGGELFERIITKGHYSERAAATVIKTIMEVVLTCHQHGVMHRDLKPENFLFANKQEDSPLRAIDFGLSVMFKPGDVFSEIVGSPYYMAPEVLRRAYGPEADVWSAGVILYILLCGVPPFWAETEQGVAQEVLKAQVDFERGPWGQVSEAAKSLVRAMLEPNMKKRLTAAQVLGTPWIRDTSLVSDAPLGREVLTRLKKFSAMNQLKKKALRVIAENLSETEVIGQKEMFQMMDADKSGAISLEELRVGLRKIGSALTEAEVQKLLEAADLNGDGTIDCSEFVAATMHLQRADHEGHLRAAFASFDRDGSGSIDFDELALALGVDKEDPNIQAIINEVDQNNDGQISYDEFAEMMRKDSEWRKNIRHFSKERSCLGDVVQEAL